MELNYFSILKYAKTVANQAGLSLRFEEESQGPRTDGRTIFMPHYNYNWKQSDPDAIQWWSSLIHECYHNLYPEDFVVLKREKIPASSPLGFILNMVVDHNIEHCQYGEFHGRDEIMEASFDGALKNIGNILADHDREQQIPEFEALFAYDAIVRRKWMTAPWNHDLEEALSQAAREKFDALMDSGLHDEYLAKKDAEQNLEVAHKLMKVLNMEEQHQQAMQQQQQAQSGEGEGEHGKEAMEAQAGKYAKYVEMLEHDHDSGEYRPNGGHIDYEGFEPAESPEHEVVKVVEVNFETGENISYAQEGTHSIHSIIDSNGLSKKIRRYLMAMTQSRREGGKRVGKIHRKNISRTITHSESDLGSRVFKKKVTHNELSSAVTILVDQSGSMYGTKYQHACQSAALLNNLLSSIGVPFEILSFTDNHSETVNFIHKSFGKSITTEKLVDQFERAGGYMNSNSDGESILWAVNRLNARKEKRRILIVLSDGSPASSHDYRGSIYRFTEDVIKGIEKSTTEIHGIGIMDDNVKRFYKSNQVIHSADELEPALLKLMKDKVLVKK